MSDPFTPIDAFGGEFKYEDAFKLDKKGILDFLKKVHDNPDKYKVPAAHKDNVKLLYTTIHELRTPDGARYVNPSPSVQLLRNGDVLQPTKKIPLVNKSEEFFGIFDILGIFLSLLGPAPDNATTKNYFLPLVVVYAKWCSELSPGSGFAPVTVQITWATGSDKKKYAVLGSSLKGFSVDMKGASKEKLPELKAKEEHWKTLVQKARRGYLKDILQGPYKQPGEAPESRVAANGRVSGWDYGNCAETYPFLYILADSSIKCSSNGIAVDLAKVVKGASYDGKQYWKGGKDATIKPPCTNCQLLMRWYGLPDFTPQVGDEVA